MLLSASFAFLDLCSLEQSVLDALFHSVVVSLWPVYFFYCFLHYPLWQDVHTEDMFLPVDLISELLSTASYFSSYDLCGQFNFLLFPFFVFFPNLLFSIPIIFYLRNSLFSIDCPLSFHPFGGNVQLTLRQRGFSRLLQPIWIFYLQPVEYSFLSIFLAFPPQCMFSCPILWIQLATNVDPVSTVF